MKKKTTTALIKNYYGTSALQLPPRPIIEKTSKRTDSNDKSLNEELDENDKSSIKLLSKKRRYNASKKDESLKKTSANPKAS